MLLRLIVPPREPALEPLVLVAAEDSLLRNLDRLAFALKLLQVPVQARLHHLLLLLLGRRILFSLLMRSLLLLLLLLLGSWLRFGLVLLLILLGRAHRREEGLNDLIERLMQERRRSLLLSRRGRCRRRSSLTLTLTWTLSSIGPQRVRDGIVNL